MAIGKGDARKARYWQQTLGEAARSGLSIREFCRRRRLKESQFYWWQRKLRAGRDDRTVRRPGVNGNPASLALVSDAAGATDTSMALNLGDGRKLESDPADQMRSTRHMNFRFDEAKAAGTNSSRF